MHLSQRQRQPLYIKSGDGVIAAVRAASYFCSTYFNLGKQFCTAILETDIYHAVEQQIKKLLSDLDRAVSSAQNKDRRRRLLESMSFKIDRLTHDTNQNKRLKNEL